LRNSRFDFARIEKAADLLDKIMHGVKQSGAPAPERHLGMAIETGSPHDFYAGGRCRPQQFLRRSAGVAAATCAIRFAGRVQPPWRYPRRKTPTVRLSE
jgi:hypothetical protein